MGNCEYVQTNYQVPACIGRRVVVSGKPGIIAEDRGHHIGVNFDSDKPSAINPCHPTSEVIYLDMGKIRGMTKSQQRYQRYLKYGDGFESFRDFLTWDQAAQEVNE